MLFTRRKAMMLIGAGLTVPSLLLADEDHRKRSRWDLLFANPSTARPSFEPDPAAWHDDTITAAWIGHATVLINFFGTWIITDPVFSERIGVRVLGFTLGPKRLVWPALHAAMLPNVDLILLSHAHMDHLDLPTLERFHPDTPVIMARNTADVIDDLPLRHVRELDWGERTTAAGVEIEALRVKHFGWRFPWEKDRSQGGMEGRSFNAYLLSKNGRSIVFGGDTAMQQYFTPIGARGLDIPLAIMPIGAYDPWIRNHCNPEQAVEMAVQLGARAVMPIHWGTFIQSDEPVREPITRFTRAAASHGLIPALTEIGQTWSLDGRTTGARR